jgi:hypothetical protein
MLFRASLIVVFAFVAACGGMPEDLGSTMPGPVLQTDADVPAPAATGGLSGHVDALPPAPAPQATGGAQAATGGQGGQGGGQPAPDAMPAGTGGTVGSDAGAAPKADGGTPAKYLGCFDPDKLAAETMCTRPNPTSPLGADFARKDGLRCAICKWKRPTSSVLDQRSGCTLAVEVNHDYTTSNMDPTPVLCVMSCGECAF